MKRAYLPLCLLLGLLLSAWRWPGEINRLCDSGREAFEAGRYDEAAARYAEALNADPDAPEIAYNLGTAYLRKGDHAKAVETYGRALEHAGSDPLRSQIHYNRGNAYFRLEQIREAANEYKKALDIDPDDADARYNYQVCLERLRKERPPPQQQGGGSGSQGGGQGQPGQERTDDSQSGQGDEQQDSSSESEPDRNDDEAGSGTDRQEREDASSGRQQDQATAPQLTEEEVDRILRRLERDERQLRPYFQPRASTGDPDDPWDTMAELERRFEEWSGSSNERDW